MAKAPVSEETLKEQFGPHLELHTARRMEGRIGPSRREAGEDTLLLLRTAMRNPTESPRKPSHRL